MDKFVYKNLLYSTMLSYVEEAMTCLKLQTETDMEILAA